eukprot:2190820-Amphidinium_carterae.1
MNRLATAEQINLRYVNLLSQVWGLVLRLSRTGIAIDKVACGLMHTVAMTHKGQLWSWGKGKHGQETLGPRAPLSIEHEDNETVLWADSFGACFWN